MNILQALFLMVLGLFFIGLVQDPIDPEYMRIVTICALGLWIDMDKKWTFPRNNALIAAGFPDFSRY